MDKEQVLEQIREQNKKKMDPYEQQVTTTGGNKAFSVGALIATMLFAIEVFCNGTLNFSAFAIWMSMESTLFIYKYVKLRRKHELIFAVLYTFFAVAFIALQILTLAGVFKG